MTINDILRPTLPGLDGADLSAFRPDSDIEGFRVPRDSYYYNPCAATQLGVATDD